MRAFYKLLGAPACRLESPFSWGFVGIPLLALKLLLPMCSGKCAAPPKFETMRPKHRFDDFIIVFGIPVEYECCPGYEPIVPLKPILTICQTDGTFKPTLKESCKIMSCPKLQEPQNGKVVYDNGSSKFGSRVQYVCNAGYYLVGTKIRKCEANGTEAVVWSAAPPRCDKIFCEPPIRIPNGQYTNRHKDKFEYNETVTYSCKPSNKTEIYKLIGESTLVCIGPDEWSSEPPICKVTYIPVRGPTTSADDLGGGLIAVIVLTVLVGAAVVGT